MRAPAKQRFHTWTIHLLPLLSIPVAIWFHIAIQSPCWFEASLMLTAWALTGGLGITIGYHRRFPHRAFHAVKALRWFMAICDAIAPRGSVKYWVALHRKVVTIAGLARIASGHPASGRWRDELRVWRPLQCTSDRDAKARK